ncbi:MAG: hypothetical protein ACRDHZ_11965 [Ktedonobacteraceae bacterium]
MALPAPIEISKNAPNGAQLVQYRGGDWIESSASAIAFLWCNWDVLFKMANSPFYAEKEAAGVWHGGGYGASADWYLASPSIGVDEGKFELYSIIRFLGTEIRGRAIYEYRRIEPRRFTYGGIAFGELPPRLRGLRWFIEAFGNIATAKFNYIGGRTAELITRQPSAIEKYCDLARYKIFLEMIEEERKILSGDIIVPRFFEQIPRGKVFLNDDPLWSLRHDLQKAKEKLLEDSRDADLSEYEERLESFPHDPRGAVVNLRSRLEFVLSIVYHAEFPRRPIGLSPNDKIKELTHYSENIPSGITAMMHTVNGLGNTGAHFGVEKRIPNIIDLTQFKVCFSAALGVEDWFRRRDYYTSDSGLV